jgi:hypothetical protein
MGLNLALTVSRDQRLKKAFENRALEKVSGNTRDVITAKGIKCEHVTRRCWFMLITKYCKNHQT